MTVCNWCKGQLQQGERRVQDNPDEAPGAVLHKTTLDCAESLKDRLEAAKLQILELYDLLTSIPSGPSEGMVSDAEGIKAQAEWNQRFLALKVRVGT